MVEVSISAVKFIYLCYTQHAEIAAESYYIKTLLDFNLPRSNLATLYQQAGTAFSHWCRILIRRGLSALLIPVCGQCEDLNVG